MNHDPSSGFLLGDDEPIIEANKLQAEANKLSRQSKQTKDARGRFVSNDSPSSSFGTFSPPSVEIQNPLKTLSSPEYQAMEEFKGVISNIKLGTGMGGKLMTLLLAKPLKKLVKFSQRREKRDKKTKKIDTTNEIKQIKLLDKIWKKRDSAIDKGIFSGLIGKIGTLIGSIGGAVGLMKLKKMIKPKPKIKSKVKVKSRTPKPKPKVRTPKPKPKVRIPKPKPKVRIPKPKPKVRIPKPALNVIKKTALKTTAKVGGKLLAKLIPGLGLALLVEDIKNIGVASKEIAGLIGDLNDIKEMRSLQKKAEKKIKIQEIDRKIEKETKPKANISKIAELNTARNEIAKTMTTPHYSGFIDGKNTTPQIDYKKLSEAMSNAIKKNQIKETTIVLPENTLSFLGG